MTDAIQAGRNREQEMSKAITPIRKEVFADQVADTLRDLIVQGTYKPGDRLVEVTLANQFGVSRGPIRDSLRRLEVEGLVEFRQPGVYVIGIGPADIDELYTLREALETTALSLALKRCTPSDWDAMRATVDEMALAARAGDPARFARADVDFHTLIYALSGHRRINDIWRQYVPVLAALLRRTVFTDDDLPGTTENHRRLYDLILDGDAAPADAELRRHLAQSHARMSTAHAQALGTTPTQ